MREDLLDYINSLRLKNFKLSTELPFSNSGIVMYLKNPKTIYVDEEQVTNQPFTQLLNGTDIMEETTTVRVYFSTDAKQKPTDYSTVVQNILLWKLLNNNGYHRKEVDNTSEYENDLQVTTIEFRFTKIS